VSTSLEPLPDIDFSSDAARADGDRPLAERPSAPPETAYRIGPRRVLVVLLALTMALAVGGVFARLSIMWLGPDHYRGLVEIAKRFDLDHEINVPTWFSSTALSGCAGLLAMICLANKRVGCRYVLHWGLLAVAFLYLSIDETANLHEILIVPLRRRLGAGGLLYFTWVIPGAACVGLFALAYLKFLFHLDKRTRYLFMLSGAVYVGGALGVEMLGGALADWYGLLSLRYLAAMAVEEVLEMVGVALFLYALLGYLRDHVGCLKVRVTDHSPT